jgi:hypothetical protein
LPFYVGSERTASRVSCDSLVNLRHLAADQGRRKELKQPPLFILQVPPLFHPLKIRSLTLHNRIVVSPMCMYSADDGMLTEFHYAHHAQFALRGPGATFIEATAVTPEGRISPQVCFMSVCKYRL